MSRILLAILSSSLLVLSAGACGSSWTVITESTPSALAGVASIGVDFNMTDAMWRKQPLADHVAEKPDWLDQQDGMELKLIQGIQDEYSQITVERATSAPKVTVHYLRIDPGSIGFFSRSTVLIARVTFENAGGVTDEIEIAVDVAPSRFRPSAGQRLNVAARKIGILIGEFLVAAK